MSSYKIHHENLESGDMGQEFYTQLAKVVAISFFKIAKTEREAGFLLTFVRDMLPGMKLIDSTFDQTKFIQDMEQELEMLETPWLRNVVEE